jgi:hypothetical protein
MRAPPPPPPPGRSPPTGVYGHQLVGPGVNVPAGLVAAPGGPGSIGGPPMAMMHPMMVPPRPGGGPPMYMNPGYMAQRPMMVPAYTGGPGGYDGRYGGGGYQGGVPFSFSGAYPPQSARDE